MRKQTMDHTHLLVLSLLAGEDMYGYQMILELSRRSDHTFEMKEGTLYPVLHGLERDGLVEAYQQEAPTGRVRKYYHLTRRGASFWYASTSPSRSRPWSTGYSVPSFISKVRSDRRASSRIIW